MLHPTQCLFLSHTKYDKPQTNTHQTKFHHTTDVSYISEPHPPWKLSETIPSQQLRTKNNLSLSATSIILVTSMSQDNTKTTVLSPSHSQHNHFVPVTPSTIILSQSYPAQPFCPSHTQHKSCFKATTSTTVLSQSYTQYQPCLRATPITSVLSLNYIDHNNFISKPHPVQQLKSHASEVLPSQKLSLRDTNIKTIIKAQCDTQPSSYDTKLQPQCESLSMSHSHPGISKSYTK